MSYHVTVLYNLYQFIHQVASLKESEEKLNTPEIRAFDLNENVGSDQNVSLLILAPPLLFYSSALPPRVALLSPPLFS